MIVRINQFDAAQAEALSGWPTRGLSGPIEYDWPGETQAFEILILDVDENGQPLSESFRQSQMRSLIPEVLAALRVGGHELVARLDGVIARNELAAAFSHLTDSRGYGRFSISPVEKLIVEPAAVTATCSPQQLPKNGTPALNTALARSICRVMASPPS